MAEPLAGLLSPDLTEEFSNPYVSRIIEAVQDDSFALFLHNCGGSVSQTIDSIVKTGAMGYHLGNAVNMAEMMPHIPADRLCMGNVDPASQFRNGTPESVYNRTLEILNECSQYPNFIISSGCDIPPLSPWDNINAFFKAVDDFYGEEAPAAKAQEKPVTTMTSHERFYAAVEHKPVDRVPVYPFMAGATRILIGATHQEWATDADKCAKGYIETDKVMPEEDMIVAAIDFVVECSAWGQRIRYHRNNPGMPDYSDMFIKNIADYAKVQPVDATQAQRMILMRDVCQNLAWPPVHPGLPARPEAACPRHPHQPQDRQGGRRQHRSHPQAVWRDADGNRHRRHHVGHLLWRRRHHHA